jgi:hypothetical protein
MMTSWIRRKSLKRPTKARFLSSDPVMSPVMLLSLVGLLILVGVFVVQHSLAAKKPPTPTQTPAPGYFR